MPLQPRKNRVLVEKILDLGRTRDASGQERTAGGIIVPADYKARGSQKAVRKSDTFMARVLAVGPDVDDPLVRPGAVVDVLTWADEPDGTRRGMYTGIDTPYGLLIEHPQDFGGGEFSAPEESITHEEARAQVAAILRPLYAERA